MQVNKNSFNHLSHTYAHRYNCSLDVEFYFYAETCPALHVTENSQCFVRDDVRKFGKIGGTKYFHQRYTLVTLAQVRKINLNTVHLLVI